MAKGTINWLEISNAGGQNPGQSWARLKLTEIGPLAAGYENIYITGKWRYFEHWKSQQGERCYIGPSASDEHLTWHWLQAERGGILNLGSTYEPGSHRSDETSITANFLSLFSIRRRATGSFTIGDSGLGFAHFPGTNFPGGQMNWQVVRAP